MFDQEIFDVNRHTHGVTTARRMAERAGLLEALAKAETVDELRPILNYVILKIWGSE